MASGWTPTPQWAPPALFVAPPASQQTGSLGYVVSSVAGPTLRSRGRGHHPSNQGSFYPVFSPSSFADFPPPPPHRSGLLPRPPLPVFGYSGGAGGHPGSRPPPHGSGNLPFAPPRFATQQPIRLMSVETATTSTVNRRSQSNDSRRPPPHRNSPDTLTTHGRSTSERDRDRERSHSGILPRPRPPTPVYSFGMSPPSRNRRTWSPPPFYDDDDDYDMVYDYQLEFEPYGVSDDDSDSDDVAMMRAFMEHLRNGRGPSPPARLRGGYECQFVTPFASEIQTECSICLSILREPFLVDCCGYRFCKSCIETVKEDHKPCPLCNKNFKMFPDKQLQRMLSQKEVYCKLKEDGCDWTGELMKLDEHLNADCDDLDKRLEGCGYTTLKCSHCEKMVPRREFKLHNIRCSGEKYTCEYCKKYSASYHKVTEDHWPECPDHPVKCPNGCETELKRSNVNKHVACDCPQTMVQCDLAHFGCKVRLPRAQMTSHIEDGAMDHISLLTTKFRQAQDEIDGLKGEFADLAFELHCLEDMNASIQQENDELLEEVEETHREFEEKDQEIERLRKMLSERNPSSNTTRQAPAPSTVVTTQPPPSNDGKSLLISNLPPSVNEQKLKSLFGPFGRVAGVNLNLKSAEAVLVFEESESIGRAMAKGKGVGLKLHGHRLCLRQSNSY